MSENLKCENFIHDCFINHYFLRSLFIFAPLKKFDYELVLQYHLLYLPPGGNKWIISVGDNVDNLFTALGS